MSRRKGARDIISHANSIKMPVRAPDQSTTAAGTIERLNFSIRDAAANEYLQLTVLAQRAKAHWGYPPDRMAEWSAQLTISPEYIARHRVEVAVDDAMRVVGMCSLEDHGDHFQLEHVWIDPAAQRIGIGSTLVRRALLAASERPVPVRLLADQYAEGFYERLGAQVVGTQPAPMPGDPERSLPVMEFRTKASSASNSA